MDPVISLLWGMTWWILRGIALDSVRPKKLHGHSCARRLSDLGCLEHKLVRQAVAMRRVLLTFPCSLSTHTNHSESCQ